MVYPVIRKKRKRVGHPGLYLSFAIQAGLAIWAFVAAGFSSALHCHLMDALVETQYEGRRSPLLRFGICFQEIPYISY